MKKFIRMFSFTLALMCALVANAHAMQTMATAKDHELKSLLTRFMPYDRSYAIWQWTESDDQAMEVQYSLKYILYDCRGDGDEHLFGCCNDDASKLNLFFSYTGQFDFYVGTRGSGPVINRLSNPALHLSYDKLKEKSENPDQTKWSVDLSVEHRSNGQVVDPREVDSDPASPSFGKYKTQIEYENHNREYFDRISRGSNYFKLAWLHNLPETEADIELSGKAYFTNESAVTWGKYASSNVKFSDFDLFQIKLRDQVFTSYSHIPTTIVALEYTIGEKGFATDSLDVFLTFPFFSHRNGWSLPFFVKAHTGPMERLSDYSRPTRSIGVGLSFLY